MYTSKTLLCEHPTTDAQLTAAQVVFRAVVAFHGCGVGG